MDRITRVADALKAHGCSVGRKGDGLRATCPTHKDKNPSLSISLRGSTVLVHCFGGCDTRRVLNAIGLNYRDIRDPHQLTPDVSLPREVVAVYPYAQASGKAEPYARKLRYRPKSFGWERRTPNGWAPGLRGLSPGLFLEEHLVDAGRVLLVEGEKAALVLTAHGFVACAPPCGAATWKDAWTDVIWRSGVREVVILPDADKPGTEHAQRAALSCHKYRPDLSATIEDDPFPGVELRADDEEAAPLIVKLVSLPGLSGGTDVVDWLDAGRTSADLTALIDATPVWAPVDPAERKRLLTAARVRRHRAQHRPEASQERPCVACGITFTPARLDARTCGSRCRKRLSRARHTSCNAAESQTDTPDLVSLTTEDRLLCREQFLRSVTRYVTTVTSPGWSAPAQARPEIEFAAIGGTSLPDPVAVAAGAH